MQSKRPTSGAFKSFKLAATIKILHHTRQKNPSKRPRLMLTVTSKSEFPYAEDGEFGRQLDMEDSSDKAGSILTEASLPQNYHIFY